MLTELPAKTAHAALAVTTETFRRRDHFAVARF